MKKLLLRMRLMLSKKAMLVMGCAVLAVGAIAIIAVLSLGGSSLHQKAIDNISEARFFMLQAENENLRVQFFTGVREQTYEIDGVATGTVPFALLNVEPRNISHIDDKELVGALQIGDELVPDIVLERNQYGRNFALDLGRVVDEGTNIVFTLNLPSDTIVFTLTPSMPEGSVSWESALEVATDHFAGILKNATNFETYVKIITDLQNLGAFWFVQFATPDGQTHFVVISPEGEIISNAK